jgi:hypothetical protein
MEVHYWFTILGIKQNRAVSIIEDQINRYALPVERNKVKEISFGKFAIEILNLN